MKSKVFMQYRKDVEGKRIYRDIWTLCGITHKIKVFIQCRKDEEIKRIYRDIRTLRGMTRKPF